MPVHYNASFLGWLVALLVIPGQTQSQSDCGGRPTNCATTMAFGTILVHSYSGQDAIAVSDQSDVNDGHFKAPDCRIQHSSLLDKYRVRPSWRVAGVDYCVGYGPAKVLKDPAAVSMAGVAVDKARKIVTVTDNNVTLDSYDFSLGGGWGVSVRAANTSILNSKFVVGSNANPPIQGTAAASNLYVANSTIEGRGIDIGNTGLIQMKGMNLTVRYCWVANAAGDSIQSHKGGILDLRYNLIEQGGLAPGAHGDFLEVFGGPFQATILYNTTYQHSGGSGGNQGLMLEPDFKQTPGVITSGEYGNNTLVATGGNENYLIGITADDIVNVVNVHDNYFDARGAYGFVRGGPNSASPNDESPKSVFKNNVNMVTGAIVQDTRRPAMIRPRPSR